MTRSADQRLCTHDELPSWCHDNAFIVTGYRRPGILADDPPGSDEEPDGELLAVPAHEIRNGEGETRHGIEPGAASGNGTVRSRGLSKTKDSLSQSRPRDTLYHHDTIYKCWQSIWSYAHNESVNIHTHLWGAATSCAIMVLHLLHHYDALPSALRPITHAAIFVPPLLRASPNRHVPASLQTLSLPISRSVYIPVDHSPNEWKDTAGFSVFLGAAITCLTLSTSFHTLACHSRKLAKRFNALDYMGIVVMIVGSFLPALHYGFYCHPHLQLLYASAIGVLGSMATWMVVSPKYATPHYRPYRTAIFLTLGLSAVVPVAHGYKMYGFSVLRMTMGLDFLILSGALYVVGALLYACRVPERFAPGKFDYVGASHQIFHCFIVIAAFAHYVCLRRSYMFWHTATAGGSFWSVDSPLALCRALEP